MYVMCSCVDSCMLYTSRLSPTLNRSSEILCFECTDVIEIHVQCFLPGTATYSNGNERSKIQLGDPKRLV